MQPPSICQLLWDTQGPSNLISDQTSRISSYAPLLWHNPLNWWDLPEDEEFVITNFCFLGNLSLKLSPAKRSKKLELSWKIDNWWWWSLWFAETLTKERIAMYCLTLPTNANDAAGFALLPIENSLNISFQLQRWCNALLPQTFVLAVGCGALGGPLLPLQEQKLRCVRFVEQTSVVFVLYPYLY